MMLTLKGVSLVALWVFGLNAAIQRTRAGQIYCLLGATFCSEILMLTATSFADFFFASFIVYGTLAVLEIRSYGHEA